MNPDNISIKGKLYVEVESGEYEKRGDFDFDISLKAVSEALGGGVDLSIDHTEQVARALEFVAGEIRKDG